MRIDDAVDFSAYVASKFTTFQSEIFTVILTMCLQESSTSRLEVATLAGQFVNEKVKAAQKALERKEE